MNLRKMDQRTDMIARTGIFVSQMNAASPRMARQYLSALLLAFSLLLGLLTGQIAGAASVADHHSETSILSPTEAPDAEPSCHPALICSGFVIPSLPLAPVISELGLSLGPVLASSQLRFDGPPIDLPPPRHLT